MRLTELTHPPSSSVRTPRTGILKNLKVIRMATQQGVPAVPEVPLPTELLTVEELAKRLKCSYGYILSLTRVRNRQTKPLPVIRPTPRMLLFDWKAVQAWLASKTDVEEGRKPGRYRRKKKAA
jgi:hypothetical protein